MRIIFFFMFLTASLAAQDSRADLAERLKALVDRRIEELRVDLYKEIDLALLGTQAPALGLKTRPVSDEFRQLHRLSPGSGRWVEAVEPGSRAERMLIQVGDVVVRFEHLESESWPMAWLIRKGERCTTPLTLVTATPMPTETAEQMTDRLWNQALRQVLPSGLSEVRTEKSVSESQPSRK